MLWSCGEACGLKCVIGRKRESGARVIWLADEVCTREPRLSHAPEVHAPRMPLIRYSLRCLRYTSLIGTVDTSSFKRNTDYVNTLVYPFWRTSKLYLVQNVLFMEELCFSEMIQKNDYIHFNLYVVSQCK